MVKCCAVACAWHWGRGACTCEPSRSMRKSGRHDSTQAGQHDRFSRFNRGSLTSVLVQWLMWPDMMNGPVMGLVSGRTGPTSRSRTSLITLLASPKNIKSGQSSITKNNLITSDINCSKKPSKLSQTKHILSVYFYHYDSPCIKK